MAAVFAVRDVTLWPGIEGESFETFIKRYAGVIPALSHAKWYILKGDRGDQVGHFGLLFDYESMAVRDYYGGGVSSPIEVQEYWVSISDLILEWDQYGSSMGDRVPYTDYPVIAEF